MITEKECAFVNAIAEAVGLPKALTSLKISWDIKTPLRIQAEFYNRDKDDNFTAPSPENAESLKKIEFISKEKE